MYAIIFYNLLCSLGILGVGHFIWSRLKEEAQTSFPFPPVNNNFSEHFLLTIGISWFIGYFCYESLLDFLSAIHLFYPTIVTVLGAGLTTTGILWLWKRRPILMASLRSNPLSSWEIIILFLLQGFLLFWNLYPSFDVDSLAFYFTTIQNYLLQGGREFSSFTDIRQTVPIGENYLFALGFALKPHSTLFSQIMHGISKSMFILGVYGAARSWGAGLLSLMTVALLISEEHLLASGANAEVRINIPLTFSVFLIGLGLFTYAKTQKREYLFLSLLAVFNVLTCKYVGINYLLCFLFTCSTWLLFHPRLRTGFKLSYKKQPNSMVILIIAAFFTLIPYGYNWFVTGTPFFPASFGPFASPFYDKIAGQLARDWHYHLSLPDAIKNVSTFMVWPGILSSKILFPLALLSSLLAFLSDKKEERLFTTGMTFFVMSVIIVILTETYVVFEMRYYRYGIGIYALACTFLIGFLLRTFLQQTFLKKFEKWITLGLVLLICAYCLHYSFNNMGNSRPQAKDIIAFLTGKETETHIIAKRYQIADQLYTELKNINPDPRHTGFLLSFSWPHTFYPIAGKNIAYINAGGFDTTVYFNEGLFAQALLKNDITFILNQLALDNNYPLPGGAAYNVFQQCGKPVSTTHSTFITLSDSCLKTVAAQHNLENAKERLNKALATIKTLPNYEPFNYPQYGGPSNIIK